MTSSRGTLEVSQATALITPTGATFNTQLSGATVSGAGGTGVVAPSDQLDFAIGSSTIEIFTQVDPTSVQSTFDTGSVAVTGDAPSVDVTGTAITSALGSSTAVAIVSPNNSIPLPAKLIISENAGPSMSLV